MTEPTFKPAKKMSDLPEGMYVIKEIKQIHSAEYGVNFVLTYEGEEYFANKRIKTAIASFTKSNQRLPSVVSFPVEGKDTFTASDGRVINYVKIGNIFVG